VSAPSLNRPAELDAADRLLSAAAHQPAALVLHGEAGIGKTTLWSTALDRARERSFRVLSARVGQAESVMAYTTVADLLGDIEFDVVDGLPTLQRLAVDRVLLRDSGGGPETDHRVIAAALLSLVEAMAAEAPVLLAIDDVQWLDASSRAVLSFTARRLRGRVGALVTERTDVADGTAAAWLQLSRPDGVEHARLGPLSMGALGVLISQRLGHHPTRPTLTRIADISGGNPFYALELARAMVGQSPNAEPTLPGSLAELVRLRVGELDGELGEILLAASCLARPRVDQLAQVAATTPERVVDLLTAPENNGVIVIEGDGIRFAHPLLAAGVYSDAGAPRRRAVHRRIADIVAQPELRARHLALATSSMDDATLQALDVAAYAARARGAPLAAAELLELAIGLGGDNPMRRLFSAECYFRVGDTEHAQKVLAPAIENTPPGPARAMALLVQGTIDIYTDSFGQAAEVLRRGVDDAADGSPTVLVPLLMMLAFAEMYDDQYDEALHHARLAKDAAVAGDIPAMTSSALAIWVLVGFTCGLGFDVDSIERALTMETEGDPSPANFRASAIRAMALAWTGDLERAVEQMDVVAQRCLERSADTEMIFVSFHLTTFKVWQAQFDDAARHAADCYERAEQMGADPMRIVGLAARGGVAALRGREAEARADLALAIELAERRASPTLAELPATMLGHLEVSLGNYAQALVVLRKCLDRFDTVTVTEVSTTGYLPDAIEALVAVGRLDDAEPLIEAMETHGRRLDRPWMLALGGRCRAMWLAARGDLDEALRVAEAAMEFHERLPMPLEHNRTRMFVGRLQRRRRQRRTAAQTLAAVATGFEELGASLWAARARGELARANVAARSEPGLTESERRVAEFVAAGLSNRDVAAKLFVSQKTVEHNLTQVYRKLEIRSRAELGRRLDELRDPGEQATD
jgi:DNA-binding CsgD family transcriptional regulator